MTFRIKLKWDMGWVSRFGFLHYIVKKSSVKTVHIIKSLNGT